MKDLQDRAHSIAEAKERLFRNIGSGAVYADQIALMKLMVDSEIEQWLGSAMITSAKLNQGVPPTVIARGKALEGSTPLVVAPQHNVGQYCLDFGLIATATGKRLAIECDGHDFHDKTPAQAAYDKARDRFLMEQGWPVLRFTGTEIARGVDDCVSQIARILFPKDAAA